MCVRACERRVSVVDVCVSVRVRVASLFGVINIICFVLGPVCLFLSRTEGGVGVLFFAKSRFGWASKHRLERTFLQTCEDTKHEQPHHQTTS